MVTCRIEAKKNGDITDIIEFNADNRAQAFRILPRRLMWAGVDPDEKDKEITVTFVK